MSSAGAGTGAGAAVMTSANKRVMAARKTVENCIFRILRKKRLEKRDCGGCNLFSVMKR